MKNKFANILRALIKFLLLIIQVILFIQMIFSSCFIHQYLWFGKKHNFQLEILFFLACLGITYFIMKKYFSKKDFIRIVVILIIVPFIMACLDKLFYIHFLHPGLYIIAIISSKVISMIVDRLYKALGFEN